LLGANFFLAIQYRTASKKSSIAISLFPNAEIPSENGVGAPYAPSSRPAGVAQPTAGRYRRPDLSPPGAPCYMLVAAVV